MAAPSKMEFAVQMTCQSCFNSVENVLQKSDGIKSFEINLEKEQVIVDTDLLSSEVQNIIEATGRRAVLQGYGSTTGTTNLGSAVAMMEGSNGAIKGVIRFVQPSEDSCVIEGTVDGLSPGLHALCVHCLGDITDGCNSCGDVFGSGTKTSNKYIGEVCDLTPSSDGRAEFRLQNSKLKVWELIGRSMVIHDTDMETVHSTHNGSSRLACGIIARSAGLFQNTKKICACDGVTLWDERDKPLAGPGRSSKM